MERTLVIIKPSAVHRQLIGEVISRFERKGLRLVAMKMTKLSDKILQEHYAHLADKPYYNRIRTSMQTTPVIVCCWEGLDCVRVVRVMSGVTNGRLADAGTIRGDFSMSIQENIVHSSDSPENAEIELQRFFSKEEFYEYKRPIDTAMYSSDEM
jgi:nucleoside-diphosphate kinase